MPTSNSTSTSNFTWTTFNEALETVAVQKSTAKVTKKQSSPITVGSYVKWSYFNQQDYRSGHAPDYNGIVEKYIGKRLKVYRIYDFPNEYLCVATDEKTGLSFNVALSELILLNSGVFYPNEKLIEKTRVLACDIGLLSQEFAAVISDISAKFLTVRIFKKDFDKVKEMLKPITVFLKKEDSDETDYLLEQLREFLLMLSKEVHADESKIKEESFLF